MTENNIEKKTYYPHLEKTTHIHNCRHIVRRETLKNVVATARLKVEWKDVRTSLTGADQEKPL